MSNISSISFIDKCVSGECHPEDIDDFIDYWHDSDTGLELYEYLGFTEKEYGIWLRYPEKLTQIIAEHKKVSISAN